MPTPYDDYSKEDEEFPYILTSVITKASCANSKRITGVGNQGMGCGDHEEQIFSNSS